MRMKEKRNNSVSIKEVQKERERKQPQAEGMWGKHGEKQVFVLFCFLKKKQSKKSV